MLSHFVDVIRGVKDPAVSLVLTRVAVLFALSNMVDGHQWTGVLDVHSAGLVESAVPDILAKLRPEAVALVDAFDFSDKVRTSPRSFPVALSGYLIPFRETYMLCLWVIFSMRFRFLLLTDPFLSLSLCLCVCLCASVSVSALFAMLLFRFSDRLLDATTATFTKPCTRMPPSHP